ncbi:MAG: transposase, partial [Rhodocyclaceae bacterium]
GNKAGERIFDGVGARRRTAQRQLSRSERPTKGYTCIPWRDPDARRFGGRQKNFTGEHFWARGYFVSTVGLDEAVVRAYIRAQEEEDDRYDQG